MISTLLLFLGETLFGAAVGVLVDDAREKVASFVNRPTWLDYDADVKRAVERAFRITVDKLRQEYRAQHPKDTAALAVFELLSKFEIDLVEISKSKVDEWISVEEMSHSIDQLLDTAAPDAPERLRKFFKERFPPLFVFAFREVGLKADEKVKAAVFEALLSGQAAAQRRVEALIISSDEVMQSGLENLGYDVSEARGAINELLDEFRKFKVRVNAGRLGDGPVIAYVRIDDPQRNTLRTVAVRERKVLIGRGGNTAIHLDDVRVSRVHAEIILDDSGALVQDRGSTHGTFFGGARLDTAQRVNFNEAIEIKPFRLHILPADAKAEELVTPATHESESE